jgi:UDPglucose 6-dehydrogenase
MNMGVLGLCHLGSVTAACLASLGHRVVGIDFDEPRVTELSKGMAPIFEPGLEGLIKGGLSSGNLRFSSTLNEARDIDVLWVAYDTPVDDDDNADTDFVIAQIERALLELSADVVVLVSSQLPVGSIRRLEQSAALNHKGRPPRIAYCPENLRLGNAVPDFLHPNRIVVGVRSARDQELLHSLLSPITQSIEWMSVESAEMTKHAINAFLATSVVFANEIAAICESVGADAKEVERGLKTEDRIGPRAYLAPGAAFAGGTLARDVAFLNRTARERRVITPLLSSILPSNDTHRRWVQRKLQACFADLSRITVTVWGLSYKPGTGSVRRSLSVDLCDWMIREGATIQVHDPMVASLPDRWCGTIRRFDTPIAAVHGADALIIGTNWPMYRTTCSELLIQCTDRLVLLDPNRFVADLAATHGRLQYFAVGIPYKDP